MKNRIEIIPAIDLIEGKCVRLSQGDYSKKTIYNENPLEVALQFEDIGIKRLHLVDLDGAKKGEVVNWKVLENIAARTKLIIDFGGGIKTDKSINIVFESGASIATIGSLAVKEPELFYNWLLKFGADKILLGADVKEKKIAISGWLEETNLDIISFLKDYRSKGLAQTFCTDISKDGMMQGPSFELYKEIISTIPDLYFIASGGVSSFSDIIKLEEIGCKGVIIGKA
ncbi:MAG: 1-(5-phosphoribosyl)-5-[(5-phosphoribosylamino)methylideneamino]imidazole-4-carboxamide isomerase, partial [Bacteroidia bacterium]